MVLPAPYTHKPRKSHDRVRRQHRLTLLRNTAPAPSDTTDPSIEDAENLLGFSSALGEQYMKIASMAGSFSDA